MANLGCVPNKAATMETSKEIVASQFEKWRNEEVNFFDLLADDVTWVVSGRSPVRVFIKEKRILWNGQ